VTARRRKKNGFTLTELFIVVIVLSILAGIALLKYLDLRNQARAAEVAGDFRSVMVAAYNYHGDHEAWPGDGSPGVIPPALAPYLPTSFTFSKKEYQLEFENMPLGGGQAMVGVTVTSTDADLMAKLQRTLGTTLPYFAAGNALTYIISSDGGA
jgi:prepilin-type N-terminal cleavage/methylation domain-containing protein